MSIYRRPPCIKGNKPCDKRYVGCHSKCEEFVEWKQARDKELDKIKQSDEIRRRLDDTNVQRILKIKEGSRRKWK